jgi:uncharacterized YigZ family protein
VDYYKTIDKEGFAEFKDRGSRFIAFAFPMNAVEVFKVRLAGLKKEHPKAVHYCFAYRIGLDGNNFRSSDDGEPSGTAGKPILGQLDSRGLTNAGLIIVRYFGGTLLGVPGLINAYKTAAALVLQVVPEVEKAVEINYNIQCSYPLLNDVMTILKQYNCTNGAIEQSLFCSITTGIPRNREEQVVQKIKELHGVEIMRVE